MPVEFDWERQDPSDFEDRAGERERDEEDGGRPEWCGCCRSAPCRCDEIYELWRDRQDERRLEMKRPTTVGVRVR